ncbi:MAG TPA: MBL fold metallo-hydrolase [Saprospiraceae bacterium]|nr:MBL fold metallo-hydrolase [Saprospiraceae bacterium]
MLQVKSFTFNDFYENTYIIFDETKECVIIDPGCNNEEERNKLTAFISQNELTPIHLLNTHCHIDHILGNKYIADAYGLTLVSHKGEVPVLEFGLQTAAMYHIPYEKSPAIEIFVDEGDTINFGNTNLEVLFTPGHSPASISFYNKQSNFLIAGDVLFQGSIGRTDLPGGNFEVLIRMIKNKFMTLPDETIVYSGHGEHTTIGIEKRTNPFLV